MTVSQVQIEELIRRGNLAQADILSIAALLSPEIDPISTNFRIRIANALGLDLPNSPRESRESGFLVIRPWGFGFWADVDHVIGQLLLAEITGRRPIAHWGLGSLFGGTQSTDAFSFFFKQPGSSRLDDIPLDASFFPPKWNRSNWTGRDINKMSGQWSRMNAIYFLNRHETVLVSDFYTKINQLMRWIPVNHALFGKSLEEIYLFLVRKYLRPTDEIMETVHYFLERHLINSRFVAVHLRGLDKKQEVTDIDNYYHLALRQVDLQLERNPGQNVFVFTDSQELLSRARKHFAFRVFSTDVTRACGTTGLHYLGMNGRKIGEEIMLDSYVAAQASYFVGLGLSNVSSMIRYIAGWAEEQHTLIGMRADQKINYFLNDW